MLVTSIFSFSNNVFLFFPTQILIFESQLFCCLQVNLEKSKIMPFGKELRYNTMYKLKTSADCKQIILKTRNFLEKKVKKPQY